MIVAELKVEIAAVGDALGVLDRVGIFGEERAHLLLALEVIFLALEAQAHRLIDRAAGLDAEEHIVDLRILALEIVRVVRGDEGDAQLVRHLEERRAHAQLLADAMVLNFQIEPVAEDLLELARELARAGGILPQDALRDLARDAAGEADEPLGVLLQQRPVDARLEIKPLGEARGDEVAEIAVAGLVFAQENEVRIIPLRLARLFGARAGGDIDLAADDRLDARVLAGLIKSHGAVHHAVVGDGKGRLPERFGALRHLADAARAVQQAVFTVNV